MTYLTGGVGECTHVLLFWFEHNTIKDFWTGVSLRDIQNKQQVVRFIENAKKKEFNLFEYL